MQSRTGSIGKSHPCVGKQPGIQSTGNKLYHAYGEYKPCRAGCAEIVSKGATEDKAAAELKAVQYAVNLAKRASIYALETNNMELHDQLRVTKTTLLRRPDTLAVAKLRDIHTHGLMVSLPTCQTTVLLLPTSHSSKPLPTLSIIF